MDEEAPDVLCQLENVQGLVDALTSVRWKRQQDAVLELSEHGIVLIVEESGCLQAKVYLKKELFIRYDYNAEGRPRFGVSLGLFVDCLNAFSVPAHSNLIQIQYPGPDMQVILKYVTANFFFSFFFFIEKLYKLLYLYMMFVECGCLGYVVSLSESCSVMP